MAQTRNRRSVYIKQEEILCRMARRNVGLVELARQIGIGHPYLSQILDGQFPVSPTVRRALQQALRCRWDEIFRFEEENNGRISRE